MKNYIKGIVGGIVCGMVAAIPWVVVYIYGNMLLSLLAIPIAIGVDFGYRKFKGQIDKKLPMIITVTTILIIVILCLVVIPLVLMTSWDGWTISWDNLVYLYQDDTFRAGILKDLMISILFAFLGIGGVINKIKSEVNPDALSKSPFAIAKKRMEEVKNIIKEEFKEHNAFDKEHAIPKDRLKEIFSSSEYKNSFNNLKLQGIIKKYKGKYYYSIYVDEHPSHRYIGLYFKILLFIVILVFWGLMLSLLLR